MSKAPETDSKHPVSPPLEMIRSATPFPLVSLFFMFIGFILSNIGHIRPHRTILAFVSGIFFILSGQCCRLCALRAFDS